MFYKHLFKIFKKFLKIILWIFKAKKIVIYIIFDGKKDRYW